MPREQLLPIFPRSKRAREMLRSALGLQFYSFHVNVVGSHASRLRGAINRVCRES